MHFLSTVIGALLAGVFGVLSALYLDSLRLQRQRRLAARTIAGEVFNITRNAETLRRADSKLSPDGSGLASIVFSRLVASNSLGRYRPLIMELLSEEDLTTIEKLYQEMVELDRHMDLVVQCHLGQGKSEEGGVAASLRAMFWGRITQPETGMLIDAAREVADKLLRKTAR